MALSYNDTLSTDSRFKESLKLNLTYIQPHS